MRGEINKSKLSIKYQNIISAYINTNKNTIFDGISTGNELWRPVSMDDYNYLLPESEYAAWVLVFGDVLNHIGIPIHYLTQYDNIEDCVELLENNNITLSTVGGKIKKSDDKLLYESSVVADLVPAIQLGSEYLSLPGTVVGFIDRKTLPNYIHKCCNNIHNKYNDNYRREGFDTNNANYIFDSTSNISKYQ